MMMRVGVALYVPLLSAVLPSSAYSVLNDTDWTSSRVSDDPVLPSIGNLSACVALCEARPDCVAVSWTAPGSAQPHENWNLCSPKCAARAGQRIHSPGQVGVVIRPNASSCPLPGWYPPEWEADIRAGSILLAGPRQEGAHVGNGYVATFLKSLSGTSGPVQTGVEHVAGVFAGRIAAVKPAGCISWCDRAHKADLPSYTSTATVAAIDGERDPSTASAMDLRRSAYLKTSTTRDQRVRCVQTTFASRARMHILVTRFHCTNQGAAPATVELTEPGPRPFPAPTSELTNESVSSGLAGVECTTMHVKVGETDAKFLPQISECHTHCNGTTFVVPPAGDTLFSCISSRHTSVDGLGPPERSPPGPDPTPAAIESWIAANASASTLFDEHVLLTEELLRPGVEVEGDMELAKILNSSVHALLATFRDDVFFGGSSSGGLSTDAYA
eukprot:Hpha_TRINITY_DN31227_c0_g1::TRINITY_DN31227_c0_g1_i1::g.2384::m.2384